ncbi:uncharacterized protein LOC119684195 [Teleopsis dalmanni]|uniref:uncharacterized protein LOC119684195 n=1 Tax=Teleopsis dalmanni TaxID=139649 RepID=UPI0018CE7D4D|nr:uncharacterized protein LOC119684195 [Teleopsis dalmanni]
MESIWHRACTHYDVPEDVAKTWYTRIRERLNQIQPTRAYHNWNEMMLRKEEHLESCKPNIVLAAFFQYFAYDGNRSCVRENCAAFKDFCTDAMLEDETSKAHVLKLLGDKAIECELDASIEDDANILQDLDLIILGAPSDVYKSYSQLLRREYFHMNDESYRLMRLKVLETLLKIPNIFSTEEYQNKYEETARINIEEEISTLRV